jgi:flagellar biosynthetic protein FliO
MMNVMVISFKKWLETSSLKQKYAATLLAFSLLSTAGLLIMKGTTGAMDDPLQASPFYFIGVFAKLGVVLLLILACSAVFRRWSLPVSRGEKKRQLQVIETVRLSPKQALHLVMVGDRQLLIGATDQNVSLLTSLDLYLTPTPVQIPPTTAKTDFASLFRAINFRSPVEMSEKG